MLARASRHVIHLEIGQPDFPAGALAYTYDANHPSGVGSVSDGRSFQYDGNGNMTTRVSGGVSLSAWGTMRRTTWSPCRGAGSATATSTTAMGGA